MNATSGKNSETNNGTHLSWSASKLGERTQANTELNIYNHEQQSTTTTDSFWAKKRCLDASRSVAIQSLILLLIVSLQVSSASVQQQHLNGAPSSSPTDRSAFQPIKDSNQIASDVIAIKEGADLDLNCPIVVQNEDVIISWTCDNEPTNIRSSRIHVTESGKLRIHSAKVGDSCNYRCEAADGFGTLSVIIKVIIVDRRLMEQLNRRAGITNSSVSEPLKDIPQQRSLSETVLSRSNQQTGSPLKSQHDNGTSIEMHIEPSQVQVNKNQTFSLECRIKHAPNLVSPQIIWLKEYIGARIDSLDEAIDKNLLNLDGVYYHSLNWPRATSYSQNSSVASSALLVKQSNYLHSGRYACFAGYPASILNLHFNNSISTLSNATAHNDTAPSSRAPMRYKIAQAFVKVNDEEGEANYKSSSNYLAKAEPGEDTRGPANIFLNVISSNTWMRNLTVILLFLCISLSIFKIRARRINIRKGPQNDMNVVDSSPPQNPQRDLLETQQPVTTISNTIDYLPEFSPDRFNLSHVPTNSLINDSNPLGDHHEIDQALLNERLNCIDSASNYNNDHVYSEIGYRIAMNNTDEPYYKRPNLMNKH